MDSYNAYHRARESIYEFGNKGNLAMSRSQITMSSRQLLEILAGRTTVSEFNEQYKMANPFEQKLSNGQMITKIVVNTDENDNDDSITFQFGASDPAISPFTVPNKSSG
jgi:hypothetical protein